MRATTAARSSECSSGPKQRLPTRAERGFYTSWGALGSLSLSERASARPLLRRRRTTRRLVTPAAAAVVATPLSPARTSMDRPGRTTVRQALPTAAPGSSPTQGARVASSAGTIAAAIARTGVNAAVLAAGRPVVAIARTRTGTALQPRPAATRTSSAGCGTACDDRRSRRRVPEPMSQGTLSESALRRLGRVQDLLADPYLAAGAVLCCVVVLGTAGVGPGAWLCVVALAAGWFSAWSP